MKTRFLTLVLTLLSAVGAWAYDFEVDGIYYSYGSSNKVYVTYERYPQVWSDIPAYTSLSGEITIPSSVSYNGQIYSVTRIGGNAFQNCSALTSVTIPNSVTSIGGNAFQNCSALTSITIPNSVTSIEGSAFTDCSALTNVYYNGSVTDWCQIDFSDMSSNPLSGAKLYINNQLVTDLVIPDEVTTIKDFAFFGYTSLTSVTIGNSVTSIGSDAFGDCSALTSVTIPNSVTSIENYAFSRCSALTSVTIPNSVTSIGNAAFSNCSSLTSVTIPSSVTSIGDKAFVNCSSLTSVNWDVKRHQDFEYDIRPFSSSSITTFTFGDEVEYIPAYLCSDLTGITQITIPNSVTSIGDKAFEGCTSLASVTWNSKHSEDFDNKNRGPFNSCTAITTFTFGDEVEYIPAYICSDLTEITQITIPNSVTSIGNYAFSSCSSLTSVTIPNSVTSIGNGAFSRCSSLTSVTIPNNVTSIGESTFMNCSSLTSVTWNIKHRKDYIYKEFYEYPPFFNCSAITTFIFGDEVEYLPAYLCYNLNGITQITIPSNVTGIGDKAFEGCSGLRSITSYATIPPLIDSTTFSRVNKSIPINVPEQSLNIYSTGEYWEEFNNYQGLVSSNQLVVMLNEGGTLLHNNDMVASGSILEISNGSNIQLQIIPDEGYGISSITCGGTDYTDEINPNGYLTLPSISSTTILQVTFERLEVHTISYYAEGSGVIFNNKINNGKDFTFYVTTQNNCTISSVTLNGTDITDQLDEEGNIHLSNILQDMVIVVSTTATPSEVSSTKPSRLRAWQADGTLFVEVDDAVEAVMVYDVTGRLMQEYQHNGGYQMLNLPAPNKVNLVKVVSKDGSVNTHKLM